MFKMGYTWYRWKSWKVYFPTISSLRKSELGRISYGSWKLGCPSSFFVFFRRRFLPNRRCCRRTESYTLQPKLSSFLKFLTWGSTLRELGRLCARRRFPGWKNVSVFQHNFFTFIDFPTHSWRSSRCWFLMILVSLESLWYLLWNVANLAWSWAWACKIQPCEQSLLECFSMTESHFLTKIPTWLG